MGRVEGKVAIVTGAASGIGRAAAGLLAREGARVAVTDIASEAGLEAAEQISKLGGLARYWQLDTTDEQAIQSVFADVVGTFGQLDVLVNNAGIAGVRKPTHELTLEEWNSVISVNLNGVFLCTKHAIPHLRRAGGGSIINMSSVYGLVGSPGAPAYHAAKGAVRLMAKTDALLYAADGIRVNSVHPGFIWTPGLEDLFRGQGNVEEGRRQLDRLHPLGHVIDGGYTAQ
jgi:NAD(P)-dependent dehydrogenase (short-subunit alcohol dehydrogenase family)